MGMKVYDWHLYKFQGCELHQNKFIYKHWVFRAVRNPLMLGRAKLKQFKQKCHVSQQETKFMELITLKSETGIIVLKEV